MTFLHESKMKLFFLNKTQRKNPLQKIFPDLPLWLVANTLRTNGQQVFHHPFPQNRLAGLTALFSLDPFLIRPLIYNRFQMNRVHLGGRVSSVFVSCAHFIGGVSSVLV